MADIAYDDQVDITDKVCPLTFVKAKVAIEELDDGEVLAIRMNDGEPVQNVPRSMKEQGHKILKLEDNEDGTYTILSGPQGRFEIIDNMVYSLNVSNEQVAKYNLDSNITISKQSKDDFYAQIKESVAKR